MKKNRYFALTLIVFLTAQLLPGIALSQQSNAKYVKLEVGGTLPDVKTEFLLGQQREGFRRVTNSIKRLKRDKRVSGVVLKINGLSVGWAKVQELRDAILSLRNDGRKEVICFLESGGNAEYMLACAGDKILLVPSGALMLNGLAAEVMFLKGLLKKVGVEADMLQIGEYKSATEPYERQNMSKAHREEVNLILDDLYGQMVDVISDGRNIEKAVVESLIDKGPFTAGQAQKAGLVDELLYFDGLANYLKEAKGSEVTIIKDYGKKKREAPDISTLGGMLKLLSMFSPKQEKKSEKSKIALIYASGIIMVDGSDELLSTGRTITPKSMRQAFEKAREDASIKAVVLRIDSPGGSALASDLIWREVLLTQEEKPVIVSMSDVAGSGGYYIAMAADTIVAEPGTITGSIGVAGGKFNFKGLYEKLGIKKEIVTRGRNANIFSDYSSFTSEERLRIKKLMAEVYRDFVSKAAEGRKKSVAEIEKVAQGRIWTGKQAKELGLVDELGGLETAFLIARNKANIPQNARVETIILPKRKTLFEYLMGDLDAFQLVPGLSVPKGFIADTQDIDLIRLFHHEKIVTMLPFRIRIR